MNDAEFNTQATAVRPDEPFSDVPVLAALPSDERDTLLAGRETSLESGSTPGRVRRGASPAGTPPRRMRGLNLNPFAARAFGTNEAVVGYIQATGGNVDSQIIHASTAEGDSGLAGKRLTLSLDRFYVHEYPGLGTHQVLCTFTVGYLARFDGQTGEPVKQDVTFGYAFPVSDREAAGINGMPLFRDLRIGDGLYMWISCINTHSSSDNALLQALTSEPFAKGLQLLAASNPVTSMLSTLVTGVAKHFLSSGRDALTFKPLLGLHIAGEPTTAKLREGSYVIAQATAAKLRWTDYRWRASEGRVVAADGDEEMPYNYMVIGIRPV